MAGHRTHAAAPAAPPAARLVGVGLRRDGRAILRGIDWTVEPEHRWVVLGPNGSGKTTLLRIASLWLHPSEGTVEVLGHELGRTDLRALRSRIGVASAALADRLRPDLSVADVVLTARRGALEPWWHTYGDDDRAIAADALDQLGVAHLAERPFATLSSGERQRVQLARTVAARPELLFLDEPAAGLDLGGREELVGRLGAIVASPDTGPTVLVTHHVEEIPIGFTHALLLRDGTVVAAGPIGETLRDDLLGETFGLPVEVREQGGRWQARARGPVA